MKRRPKPPKQLKTRLYSRKPRAAGAVRRARRAAQPRHASYSEYLASPHWQSVRERYWGPKKLPLRARHCVVCRVVRDPRLLQLHHQTYVRIGRELLTDLVPLCAPCHLGLHNFLRANPRTKLKHAVEAYRQHLRVENKRATFTRA